MSVVWNEELYGLGIETIDNQHRELFTIASDLEQLKNDGYDRNALLLLLKRLYSYTSYHFLSEEELFHRFEYPSTETHQTIHQEFTGKIKDTFDEVKKGAKISLDELLSLIVSWVDKHIKSEDREYARFFEEHAPDLFQKAIPQVPDQAPQKGDGQVSGTNSEQSSEVSSETSSETSSGPGREAHSSLWDEQKLSLNISEIDNQHRELVGILQQVSDLNKTGVTSARVRMQLSVLIKKLYYYTQFHFDLEEALMKRSRFPELAKHAEVHRGFMDRVKDFATAYHRGESDLTDEIVLYLKDWTVEHILKEDKEIVNWMRT